MQITQSCPTLCDPTVYGILQARILEWVDIPSPGDLPNPGIEPGSPALQVDSLLTGLSGNLIAMQETQVQSLNGEDLLEKETANHSSILA